MSRKINGVSHPGNTSEYQNRNGEAPKLLLFRQAAGDFAFYLYENRIWHVEFEEKEQNKLPMGTVVLGRIEKLLPEMHAVFVRLQQDTSGFLSIPKSHPMPKQNDYVLVQVIKDAQKNKECEVSRAIELPDDYFVIKAGHGNLQVSKKLSEEVADKLSLQMKEILRDFSGMENSRYQDFASNVNVLCRTDAAALSAEDFRKALLERLLYGYEILELGKEKSLFSIIHRPEPAYVQFVKRHPEYGVAELVTDSKELYEEASSYIKDIPIRLYEDADIDLASVYRIPTLLKEISERKVLLPSGGSIVIEQTEALVAIDVNTGKKQKKMDEEYVLAGNLEAAKEIFYQLQARNLSGMILIDFINMKQQENIQKLIEAVKTLAKKDRIYCRYVDYTGLGLVELTRQKTSMPLHEKRVLDKFDY